MGTMQQTEQANSNQNENRQKLRFAIIGTGGMGRKYAGMLNEGQVEGAELTAVVCRSTEAKQWAADTLNHQIQIYSSAEELFEHASEYDACFIVTPHKTHPQLAVRAFELGKHVFCDKPAGTTILGAEQMNAAAQQSGMLYAMMFHQRLYAKYIRMKEILTSGELGSIRRVMLVNSRYYRTQHYHKSGTWRSSWEGEGGGALINQGQHILDIWQWLFGMPEKIYANIPFGKYNDFDVDDEATIHMNYPNKMTAVFLLTTGEAVWEERMEIIGTRGTLLMEDNKLTRTIYSEDFMEYGKSAQVNSREGLTFTTVVEEWKQETEPYVEMMENFVRAVQGKEKLAAPGAEGLNALMLTNAAYLSAWEHREVTLPIDAGEYENSVKKSTK